MKLNNRSLSLALGLCLSASIINCATVQAADAGVIRFSGQIVEASCEVVPVTQADFGEQGQLINVAPGVEVMSNTDPKACGSNIPFTTRFEPLVSSPGVTEVKTLSGTVVVTYL